MKILTCDWRNMCVTYSLVVPWQAAQSLGKMPPCDKSAAWWMVVVERFDWCAGPLTERLCHWVWTAAFWRPSWFDLRWLTLLIISRGCTASNAQKHIEVFWNALRRGCLHCIIVFDPIAQFCSSWFQIKVMVCDPSQCWFDFGWRFWIL